MQEEFAKRYNVDKWGITMHEEAVDVVFPMDKLVYLTGDAQEEVNQLEQEYLFG